MKALLSPAGTALTGRRKFLGNTLKLASGFALLHHQPSFAAEITSAMKKRLTVQEVINLILKEGKLEIFNGTVDTIKWGRADQIVTGIVTTMFATVGVIEEAARQNANFIISHEPLFYNHKDDLSLVKNNSVVKHKQQLLDQHKIAVWRFHDYCHSLKPDPMMYSIVKKMNWLSYYQNGKPVVTIPPVPLLKLVNDLKFALGIEHVRVIGDTGQSCKRLALLPGAWGGQRQLAIVEEEKPDVLIVGELSEWETAEYIRDARAFGSQTSLIILGHSVSEEPGMEWVADWLSPKLKEIKVTHLASHDPFIWI